MGFDSVTFVEDGGDTALGVVSRPFRRVGLLKAELLLLFQQDAKPVSDLRHRYL